MTKPHYRLLTTRKRAVVALAHAVAFWILAVATSGIPIHAWHPASPASAWMVAGIYAAVTLVLLTLTSIARGAERLYFGLCSVSAGFGLARQIVGDPALHYAVYVRIAMLTGAIVTGVSIFRSYAALSAGRSPRD